MFKSSLLLCSGKKVWIQPSQVKPRQWKGGQYFPLKRPQSWHLPLARGLVDGYVGYVLCVEVRMWPSISPKLSGTIAFTFPQRPNWKCK